MNSPQTKKFTLILLTINFVTGALWGGIAFSQITDTPDSSTAAQEESTISDNQGEIAERGIPNLPQLQRKPVYKTIWTTLPKTP